MWAMTFEWLRKGFRVFFLAPALCVAAGAQAANWHVVPAADKARVEVDLASMERKGKVIRAWTKEIYFRLEQARPGDFYYKSLKTLARYHCDTRTIVPIMRIYYDESGAEIKTLAAVDDNGPVTVVPDSLEEARFNYLCQYKPPVKKKKASPVKKPAAAQERGQPKTAPAPEAAGGSKPAAPVAPTPAKDQAKAAQPPVPAKAAQPPVPAKAAQPPAPAKAPAPPAAKPAAR
jgi:hypothetical protein